MMGPVLPNSLDLLATNGVVPYDVNAFLFNKPSQALQQLPQSFQQQDTFNNNTQAAQPEKNGWKKFGNLFMATVALTVGALVLKNKKPETFNKITKPIKSAFNAIKSIFKKTPKAASPSSAAALPPG